MELEEMKNLWEDISQKVNSQKIVTDKIIIQMTQQKFKNKFSRLSIYEISGSVICFVAAMVILKHLEKMDTWYLMAASIIALLFLTVLPILSLRAIQGMKKLNVTTQNYKDTLKEFTLKKKNMLYVQKFGALISIIMLWVLIPVMSMIMNDKDFFAQEHELSFWIFLAVSSIGVLFFARWGYGCYKSITASAENILKELEE